MITAHPYSPGDLVNDKFGRYNGKALRVLEVRSFEDFEGQSIHVVRLDLIFACTWCLIKFVEPVETQQTMLTELPENCKEQTFTGGKE